MTTFNHDPITEPVPTTKEMKKGFSRRNKIIAGVAAGAAIFGTSAGVFAMQDGKETAPRPVATGEAVPGSSEFGADYTREQRDALPPEQYVYVAEDLRATDRAERFNTHLATAWDTIQQYGNLSEEEKRVLYMPDLNKPRAEWTDQDYANYGTLATWLVTTQADPDEGLRALSVVYNKDRMPESWDLISTWIKEHPGVGFKSVYEVVQSHYSDKELYDISAGSIRIGSEGGRFVQQRALSSEKRAVSFTLYKNFSDGNANIIPIKEGNYTNLSDPDLRSIIQ